MRVCVSKREREGRGLGEIAQSSHTQRRRHSTLSEGEGILTITVAEMSLVTHMNELCHTYR